MQYRTDLALEAAMGYTRRLPADAEQEEQRVGELVLHRLTLGPNAAQVLERAPGTYLTAQLPPLTDNEEELDRYAETIGEALRGLLPKEGLVLVVGLGNAAVTPDALGPRTAGRVLATRHLLGEFSRAAGLEDLRPVAVLTPGVLGTTGMESGDLTAAVCARFHPVAVIAVDALAAGSLSRLGCTVQVSDTGIAPGSGVGNNRPALNHATLGVPVIGLGIPTVVDAVTVARDLTGTDGGHRVTPDGRAMIVTPREVDLMIRRAARLAALIINGALHPTYTAADLVAAAE